MELIIGVVCLVVGAIGGMFVLRNNPKLMPKLDDLAAKIDGLYGEIANLDAERAGSHRDVVATKGMPSVDPSGSDARHSLGGDHVPMTPGTFGGELRKDNWARMIRLAEFRLAYYKADGRWPEFVLELESWIDYCKAEMADAPE